MRTMVAGSVRRRLALARTLISTNSRGRSKAGRIVCCRFGLRRLMRDDGLITGFERATFRGFLMGHKSMGEGAVLVNTIARVVADVLICPAERSSAILCACKNLSSCARPGR